MEVEGDSSGISVIIISVIIETYVSLKRQDGDLNCYARAVGCCR
jgi:hypothetical protein